jgi:hypothetical protein
MFTFFRRSGTILVLLAATGLMALLSLGLIIWLLLGTEFAPIQRLICTHNLTTSCVIQEAEAKAAKAIAEADVMVQNARKEVATMEAEIAARQADLENLEREKAALREIRDRLERIENASESYVIFTEDRGGVYPVITGWRYASLLEPNRLTAGWCYFDVKLHNSSDKRTIYLTKFDDSHDLIPEPVSDATLTELGLSSIGLESLRARCVWPEGVS